MVEPADKRRELYHLVAEQRGRCGYRVRGPDPAGRGQAGVRGDQPGQGVRECAIMSV